jgi:hypothetical protein
MTTQLEIHDHPFRAIARSNPRIIDWLERLALFFAVLFLCLHSLPRAWRSLNTDFPNYYIAAQLVHQGYDTSRMYEWSWIEREKDHRNIDIRVIGLLPITPFSTLAVLPLTGFAPLTAKHIWILLNLIALVPITWMLRAMTGLSGRRVAIILLLSFPLYRNLLYGQFYVILLLLVTAACFSYLRGHRAFAGALVALAAVCKIFPLLLFVFFLRHRQWRALASGIVVAITGVAVSIALFGLSAHRVWLYEILPWVMRGEALGTYTVTPSISGVLHCLFLAEPQWNPHPWHPSPLLYSLLAPTLQILVLAPAILLIRKADDSRERILLEWSALLTASLAVSTIPASYNFVLVVFPVCVLASILLRERRYLWICGLSLTYLGIGFPFPVPQRPLGVALMLYIPRLPLMLALLIGIYVLLWRDARRSLTNEIRTSYDWTQYAWAAALIASVLFSIRSTFRTERAEREEYAFRLPLASQAFSTTPQSGNGVLHYTAFTLSGYRLIAQNPNQTVSYDDGGNSFDDLSSTSDGTHVLVERASAPDSRVVDLRGSAETVVDNAHDPMLSSDGRDLAFVRDDHGRGQLILRGSFQSHTAEVALTSPSVNVYDASFLSREDYAYSAVSSLGWPTIFLTDATHRDMPLGLGPARYPALSTDGRWLAYSRLDHGVWNLWIRDQNSGQTRRVANLPCNQVHPIWDTDSKTLLYATDCGRSLWFTAIARRKVVP